MALGSLMAKCVFDYIVLCCALDFVFNLSRCVGVRYIRKKWAPGVQHSYTACDLASEWLPFVRFVCLDFVYDCFGYLSSSATEYFRVCAIYYFVPSSRIWRSILYCEYCSLCFLVFHRMICSVTHVHKHRHTHTETLAHTRTHTYTHMHAHTHTHEREGGRTLTKELCIHASCGSVNHTVTWVTAGRRASCSLSEVYDSFHARLEMRNTEVKCEFHTLQHWPIRWTPQRGVSSSA